MAFPNKRRPRVHGPGSFEIGDLAAPEILTQQARDRL